MSNMEIIEREREAARALAPTLIRQLLDGSLELSSLRTEAFNKHDISLGYDVYEEIVDQFLKEKYNPFGTKFGPGHFRRGTVFITMTNSSKGVQQHTAKKIHFLPGIGWQIGTDEVFETMSAKDREELGITDYEPCDRAYHITHVRGIVSVGDGESLVNRRNPPSKHQQRLDEKDKQMYQRDLPWLRSIARLGINSRKRVIMGAARLVWEEVLKLDLPRHVIVDRERLMLAIQDQTFIKWVRAEEESGWVNTVLIVDNKRVKRWLKRNINRYLMSHKRAEEVEEEIQRKVNEDEWARDRDNEY